MATITTNVLFERCIAHLVPLGCDDNLHSSGKAFCKIFECDVGDLFSFSYKSITNLIVACPHTFGHILYMGYVGDQFFERCFMLEMCVL